LSRSTKYLLGGGLLAASALAWVASLRAGAAMPGDIAGFTALWTAPMAVMLLSGGLIARREDHYSSQILQVNADGFTFSYPGRTAIAMQSVWRGP
jgi:hypothetical protein